MQLYLFGYLKLWKIPIRICRFSLTQVTANNFVVCCCLLVYLSKSRVVLYSVSQMEIILIQNECLESCAVDSCSLALQKMALLKLFVSILELNLCMLILASSLADMEDKKGKRCLDKMDFMPRLKYFFLNFFAKSFKCLFLHIVTLFLSKIFLL